MRGSEQRVQANSEAIKFTRNLKAVTEKKVAMENRNRSRMQVRVKPDQNLAAALESVRKGVTAKGQGGSLKERAKQASGAGPRARTPNASARSPFSGRVRTSGTADDRPRPAWRGSSATGASSTSPNFKLARRNEHQNNSKGPRATREAHVRMFVVLP